jgi:hypothetical protein
MQRRPRRMSSTLQEAVLQGLSLLHQAYKTVAVQHTTESNAAGPVVARQAHKRTGARPGDTVPALDGEAPPSRRRRVRSRFICRAVGRTRLNTRRRW